MIQHPRSADEKKTSTSSSYKKKMPRRSPRNHNSSKVADTEIAAPLTTLHIYEVQNGTQEVKDEERGQGGTKSEH